MIDLTKIKLPLIFLLGSIILVLTGLIIGKSVLQSMNYERKVAKFEKTLHKKEKMIKTYVARIQDRSDTIGGERYFMDRPGTVQRLRNAGLSILIYEMDTLSDWTDNTFPTPEYFTDTLFQKGLIFLGNAWFRPMIFKEGDEKIVGLILLKHQYPYENKFLKNRYQKGFRMPPCVVLMNQTEGRENIVHDTSGNPIFSLSSGEVPCRTFPGYLISGIYFCALILILLFFSTCISILETQKQKTISIIGLGVLLVVINILLVQYRIPSVVFDVDLFSPYYFANSKLLGSLGNFFITSVFILFFFSVFTREFSIPEHFIKKSKNRSLVIFVIFFLLTAIHFAIMHYLFRNVLLNSSISFEPYRVLDLTFYSLMGMVSISLIFISAILFINKVVMMALESLELKQIYSITFGSMLIFPLFASLTRYSIDISPILLYLLLVLISTHARAKVQYQYSFLTLFVFLFALYSVFEITAETKEKEKANRKVLAVNLGAKHDPVAELMLSEISQEIRNDQKLRKLLDKPVFNMEEWDEIYFYLDSNYFSGYWDRYDLLQTICNDSSILLVDEEKSVHCLTFFEEMIEKMGEPVQQTNFHYLDNQTGNVSYSGSFEFTIEDPEMKNYLFLELVAQPVFYQLGYPELLMDKRLFKPSPLDKYSYAKYFDGELITQSGDFAYSLNSGIYDQGDEEFSFFTYGGYDHLMYKVNQEKCLIISKPEIRIIDLLTSFSYLFVFLYLVMGFFLILTDKSFYLRDRQFNFKMKIEVALISILLLALLMIGGGAVYFSIKEYETKHYENISEKIRSVYVELEHKLIEEKELTHNWSSEQYASLNDLLLKFSNVFYSDINLYDASGDLLATSRPEIFEKSLKGRKINNEAYRQLTINNMAEYVHNETIGELNYLSAYVPFVNKDNKLLAYLNLPYFTQQSILAKEISNLVVAIVNFSVLLILLTIAIAVIISNKITNPLRLIQKKFRDIELGKPSEHISYSGQDEIGSLVSEYNRMVDELTRSVELLAKSERESAWREMAKQIAHEIKNPLTPMKLSVQQLQRSWEDKAPDWQDSLSRFSKTLIDQIDNLSSIANAFSDFAKMPKTNNEPVDIVAKINNSVGLFENTENIDFEINLNDHKELYVFADKEQLLRVFANLIKNAIQSIPSGRRGLIKIDMETKEERVVIKVEDNGKGIPETLGDKLFVPNFTTKSSGMGLGLAIVKNIVEDAHGTIRYETEMDQGTTFIIELPIYRKDTY